MTATEERKFTENQESDWQSATIKTGLSTVTGAISMQARTDFVFIARPKCGRDSGGVTVH